MPADPTSADWKRLGGMLEQRRVEMDPRYKNLALFAEERGINYRLAWDAETGRRANYRRTTRRAIEVAYGLLPGAIEHALAGGAFPQAGRQHDSSPRGLMHRLDQDGEMDEDLKRDLRRMLGDILREGAERKANGGEERRRA